MWTFTKTNQGVVVTNPIGETMKFILYKKFHLDTSTYAFGVVK